MIRMYARRWAQAQIAAGTDEVIVGLSLPSGSRLNNVSIDWHMLANSAFAHNVVAVSRVEGYIVPVLDPDSTLTFDQI